MEKIYPAKLQAGDEVRIIAPSRSMAIISQQTREIANQRFADLGLKLSFGKHVEEIDDFVSSSIASRVEDLHDAFADQNVKAILTVIGGFNSNQLLKSLDWELIRNNPKILCGYSDISILNNAIYHKAGLVNYYGPHYSTFGMKLHFDYTLEYFKRCLMQDQPYAIAPSESWTDDAWFMDQEKRTLMDSEGWQIIYPGSAAGTIIGGNLGTFSLLRGSEFFPSLDNSLLFIEDDETAGKLTDADFDRNLQALINLPDFSGVKGIVIGRFQLASQMSPEKLAKIISSKKELAGLPIIAAADFGHTDPRFTFPIGGEAKLEAQNGKINLELLKF